MDMTREFIEKIQEMDVPHEIDYAGRKFTDKDLTALPREITASPLETSTLTSIVDYIKNGADKFALDKDKKFIIHVLNYNKIRLFKEMNSDKDRDYLISAVNNTFPFPFGQFMSIEQFIINLQSAFVQDESTKTLLEFVGSVKDDTSVAQQDDGVTQKVTAKTGISLAKTVNAPNPVYLRPFRTFSEIEQPQSALVFRIRKDDMHGITAALFEADGDAWKHTAITSIKEFFKKELADRDDVIILA